MKRSSAILQHRRAELEARIEEMIGLLDILDGDTDLEDTGDDEPSLGGPAMSINGKLEYDLELATDEYGIADGDALHLITQEGFASTLNDIEYRFDGAGHYIGRKLLRDHVRDRRKHAKALDRTRVSSGYARFV
jgi:hypothetical protein